jgi:hypothetical protein
MQDIPFVPRLVFMVIAITGLFQSISYNQAMQGSVAQRIWFIDELTESMLQKKLASLESVLGRFSTNKEHYM